MNRREASKKETRELIMKAAQKLFKQKGPDRCTMRDIAEEAGVSAASIVVHFKNKAALLEYTLYENIEQNIQRAIATMPLEGSMPDRLMHIADVMYHFYATDRELYRVLIRNTLWEPPQESPRLAHQMERYSKFFIGMIEEEKEKGNVKSSTDPLIAASSLFYIYLNILMEFLRIPEMTVTKALEQLKKTALQHLTGILTQRGREET